MSTPPYRAKTQPAQLTLEWVAAQADVAILATDRHERWIKQLADRLQVSEGRLIEVCGLDGKGGALHWIGLKIDDAKADLSAKQLDSATAQGMRLGAQEKLISEVQLKQVDMSARYAAVVATFFSLLALCIAVWKASH